MNINIYNNTSDNKVVHKNINLLRENVSVQIWEPCSVENPVLLISGSSIIPNGNYIYIPDWGRYYYITDKTILQGDKCQITCKVDVLMSFFTSCGSSPVIAKRSSSKPDYRIDDNRVLKLKEPKILVKNVGCSLPVSSGYNYVLTLTGK